MSDSPGVIATMRVKSITDRRQSPYGLTKVPVLSWHKKDSEFYTLSPYYLKTDGNEENINSGNIIFELIRI